MPRPKMMPDTKVLDTALDVMRRAGPEGLTFASLADASGLSAAALVQRFSSKAGLKQRALLRAWDMLDERTARLAAETPRSPEGAVKLLAGLSADYGGIESYAEGLLILREDLRDPQLRARGAAWKKDLCRILDDCFAGAAKAPEGIGLLMATQWQGALLWWSFEPSEDLPQYVSRSLDRFLAALARPTGR